MKSEKAKDILNDGSCHVSDGILSDGHRVGCSELTYYSSAIEAVEIAEQEAEERMRAKAIKAYCQSCHGTAVGECLIGTKNCGALRDFIQKLTENEND